MTRPGHRDRRPARYLLHPLRPAARALLRLRWDVRVHGTEHFLRRGPVIAASNHVGLIDGPLLSIFAPRPVHALTKEEMFVGPLGPFLRMAGQIPLDRFAADPRAVRACLRTLEHGGVVGIFPEGTRGDGELRRFHHGAAYLALATGAPVVPVTMIGTRPPGGGRNAVPETGGRIDVVCGEPWRIPRQDWPRRREHVREVSALLREHMQAQVGAALDLTSRCLPGPLPAGQSENDPDTGFVDHTDSGAP